MITPNSRLEFFKQQIGKDSSNSPSGVGRWLNTTLVAAEDGFVEVEFTVTTNLSNPMGVLHGGAAAAIMDDIVGMMIFMLNREYAYVSINLNCDFLNPAPLGTVLRAQAKVIRAGKTVIHCEAKITNQEGKIIAKCSTNMTQTSVKLP